MESSKNQILLATGGYDFSVKLWRPQSGTVVKNFQHSDSTVNSIIFGPNHRFIYTGGYQIIKIFDKEGGNHPITVFNNIQKNITSVRSNSDERWLLTSGEDGFLRVWDLSVNKPSQLKFNLYCPQNSCCILSNDIFVISCGSDGNVNIWDIRANKSFQIGSCFVWEIDSTFSKNDKDNYPLKHTFKAHDQYGLYSTFSQDSRSTCSSDKTIKIWKTADFSLASTLKNPKQRWVWSCAFSLDSQYLISGSSDSRARLWHIEKQKLIREYSGHQNPITAIDFCDISQ